MKSTENKGRVAARAAACLLLLAVAASAGCASMMEDKDGLAQFKKLEREDPRFIRGWQRARARNEDNKGTWSGEVSTMVKAAFKLDVGEGFRLLARRTEAALEERDLKRIYTYGYLRGKLLKISTHEWMYHQMITTGCQAVFSTICGVAKQGALCASEQRLAATCTKLNADYRAQMPPLYEPRDLVRIQKRGKAPDDTDNQIRLAAFKLGLAYGFPADFDVEAKDYVAKGFAYGCERTTGALKALNVSLTPAEQQSLCSDVWRRYSRAMTDHCRQSDECKTKGRCRSAGFFCA